MDRLWERHWWHQSSAKISLWLVEGSKDFRASKLIWVLGYSFCFHQSAPSLKVSRDMWTKQLINTKAFEMQIEDGNPINSVMAKSVPCGEFAFWKLLSIRKGETSTASPSGGMNYNHPHLMHSKLHFLKWQSSREQEQGNESFSRKFCKNCNALVFPRPLHSW